ncbi:hypothetical protein CHS0354_041453 [Potamilus streckersoni]|uniref:TMEM248/TMEM219 domain-containing protein n=1 Tax=Potamilus streckersoni TaxID=2493646 RepID=A0AAE0T9Y4_9BIVA|nr:hypothetical protein CHS0354_041453 [Potamilus streckersoni]
MTVWRCENLCGFASSRPPLVLFVFCLAGFAVVLVSLAYFVKVKDLLDSDAHDWNKFLYGLTTVNFCVLDEYYDEKTNISRMSSYDIVDVDEEDHKLKNKLSKIHDKLPFPKQEVTSTDSMHSSTATEPQPDDTVMVSVSMWVEMHPTRQFISIPHNVTHLATNVTGRQLGLQDELSKMRMNVSLILPFEWNSASCSSTGDCQRVRILTCVNFQAPARFFPKYRKPENCLVHNETGVPYYFTMVGLKKSERKSCQKLPSLSVQHENDPALNIMLSLHDRSVINLHLMHTSYFLFVMVVTLLCYAVFKSGKSYRAKQQTQHSEVSSHP